MIEPAVLSSSFRRRMKIKENGEELVDLRTQCPTLKYLLADYLNRDGSHIEETEDAYFVRESISDLLRRAETHLPKGYAFLVRCGYRNSDVQERQYKRDYADLRKEHPDWLEEKLDLEIVKRTDPADVSPHCTGGAIDLSVIDTGGSPLDMGTKMGDFSRKSYTYSDQLTATQASNRQILLDAMLSVGFFSLPTEWWHFSYGDREWAYENGKTAIYGRVLRTGGLEVSESGLNYNFDTVLSP